MLVAASAGAALAAFAFAFVLLRGTLARTSGPPPETRVGLMILLGAVGLNLVTRPREPYAASPYLVALEWALIVGGFIWLARVRRGRLL